MIAQFYCYSNSSKNITCPPGKFKTEFTSPIAKFTSPGYRRLLSLHTGLGISPSYYECDPQLLSKANRRTIAPTKELKILVITVLYHNKIPQFNLSFGLHYSRDTSIQGKQNLVPKKCSHDLCICYLYLRETSIISGVRDTLCAPNPWFITSIKETP